jgi:hypothetical protein
MLIGNYHCCVAAAATTDFNSKVKLVRQADCKRRLAGPKGCAAIVVLRATAASGPNQRSFKRKRESVSVSVCGCCKEWDLRGTST